MELIPKQEKSTFKYRNISLKCIIIEIKKA